MNDFFASYKQAAWEKDFQTMTSLYDKEIVIFDMWDDGFLTDFETWAKIIKEWLGSLGDERVQVDFENVKIQESGDTGFAHALIGFKAISADGEVLRSMKNRISLGFMKRSDGWKVVHQHTSAPVSSSDLSAVLDI